MELYRLLVLIRLGACLTLGVVLLGISIYCGQEFRQVAPKNEMIGGWLAVETVVTFAVAVIFLFAAIDADVIREIRKDEIAERALEKIQRDNTEIFDDADSP